jgi:dihydrofolate reductase
MEAILAVDINNGLSKNGLIPWKSKKDMQFFSEKTKNNIVIMGKNTYFSLPEKSRPLKDRLNIVLTSDTDDLILKNELSKYNNILFTKDDKIYNSILESREKYLNTFPSLSSNFKIYIIGGKQIYEKFIPLCETVWFTQIKKEYMCDLVFEYILEKEFKESLYYENDELKITKYNKN